MASLFRLRRSSEPQTGGKILRGRRPAAAAASPYARPSQNPPPPPQPSLPPPPIAESGNPNWLQGFFYGAGKFISSAFVSDHRSDSTSSSYSSSSDDEDDEDADLSSNKEEDAGESPAKFQESDQGKKLETLRRGIADSTAIVSRSESKLAIEQLLLQETFSRDECDRFVKIIKSRVLDSPSEDVVEFARQKDILNRTTDSTCGLSGAWRSLNNNGNILDSVPYSSTRLGALSPCSHVQASPDLCDTAVKEAKKWLEEKKLASSSKHDEHGPCTLNTDMLQYGIEGEVGSPVDLAKSYMLSLPPWKSSFLGNMGFRTPPPSEMCRFKDETNQAIANYSLPSSKFLRRNYYSMGLWDSSEESRRVRLKLSGDSLDASKHGQTGTSSKLFENETSKTSLASDDEALKALATYQDANSSQVRETCSSTARLLDGAVISTEETASQVQPPDIEKSIPLEIHSVPDETVGDLRQAHESSLPTSIPSEPTHAERESGSKSTIPDALILDENNDAMEPTETGKQDGDSSNSRDVLSDAKVLVVESAKSAALSKAEPPIKPDETVQLANAQTIPDAEEIIEINNSSHVNIESGLRDLLAENEDPRIENTMNGSTNKISADGLCSQSNGNSDFGSSTNGDPDSSHNHELLSEGVLEAPAGDKSITKSQNGTRMRSIERMLTKPQSTGGRRGRKGGAKAGGRK
uniref:Protein KAKU4 n=1 Tax=Ananas comosus var. bracteatus TaxID=296719 RepID=A0A6V7PFX5_ANACO|nr:unnamed protein product [Ananas comosus var. bracteatus]